MFTIIHTVTISSIQSIAFTDRGTGSLPYTQIKKVSGPSVTINYRYYL